MSPNHSFQPIASARIGEPARRGLALILLFHIAGFVAGAQDAGQGWSTNWWRLRVRLEKALEVWDAANAKTNVIVAVIDGGFRTNTPALESMLSGDLTGKNFTEGKDHPFRDPGDVNDNHATVVATILGARPVDGSTFRGISPNVHLLPVRWSSRTNPQNANSLSNALNYAIDQGAKIINISSSAPYVQSVAGGLAQVFQRAESEGVLVVVAAGNDSYDLDSGFSFYAPTMYEYTNMICVTGVLRTPRPEVVHLNYGRHGAGTVDIAAPADGIYGPFHNDMAVDGYTNGTSFATAIVSGAAALVWGLMPELEAFNVRNLLLHHAAAIGEAHLEAGVTWGNAPPAKACGILDLTFLRDAYHAYTNGLAYCTCFAARNRNSSPESKVVQSSSLAP